MHTIETVKAELPDIRIKIDGKVLQGKVRGRLNKFAAVHTDNNGSYEYAWSTIVNALNNDRPLIV